MKADDLLSVAGTLLEMGGDAAERRAVSTAYYALFHLLIDSATQSFLQHDPELRKILARTFEHKEMKAAAGAFPKHVKTGCSEDLKRVKDAFIQLQEARHHADYEPSPMKTEARVQIEKARGAFAAWRRVESTEEGRGFLLALLLHERLMKNQPKGTS